MAAEVAKAPAAKRDDSQARWEEYVAFAKQLPLLTDQELRRWAQYDEAPTIVNPADPRIGWQSEISAQFIIRLRRTLLAKFPEESGVAS